MSTIERLKEIYKAYGMMTHTDKRMKESFEGLYKSILTLAREIDELKAMINGNGTADNILADGQQE